MVVGGHNMHEPLQLLLLNAFFLLAPLFLVQQFEDHPVFLKHKNALSFLAGAFIVIASMSFPIRVSPEFYIDLRWVPLLLTHVYVGYVLSVPLAILILAYRLLALGGDGAFMAYVALFVFLIPPKLFLRPKWRVRRKMLTSGALTAGYGLACTVALYLTGSRDSMTLDWVVPLFSIQLLVTAAITALLEHWTWKDETKLKQRQLLAEKLEKFDLVSQLAASVSHEVRNPLTVTRGFLQLMRSGGQSERERQQYIALAMEELDRAQSIIADYLSFAKQDPTSGKLTVFDAGSELAQIANVIKPYALIYSVLIETELEADCRILGHAGKFHQCVVNLCKNAIEAMPRAGTVRIALSRDAGATEALLTIQDEGVGMDRRQIERIGTAYATTKENGTGLGLSVVCRVVEEMGGRIRFASEVGRGTTVYVHLPLETPERLRWEESYGALEPGLPIGTGA